MRHILAAGYTLVTTKEKEKEGWQLVVFSVYHYPLRD
jgi:hypothetical protein